MARERIPVNKKLIEWARKRAGFTLEEAAKKFSHIAAWEAGTSFPTYPQLESLADEFKLPVAVFFFPEPPTLPPIRESFRTLPDAEFAQIPRQVRFLLRKAKAFQLNLAELTQGRNPASRLITRDLDFPDDISIDGMAGRVREYLRITLADQSAWPDDETALKAWRQSLHDVGIFVFKDAFRVEGYSGFSLYDDLFPIIYVNNSSTKTRQIFTLFHELAHLVFHTSGLDTIDDSYIPRLAGRQKRIEILCNQFAAQFLVPEAAFNEAIAGHDRSERTAELLAARFHVSREVIYRKFLDRLWIDQAEYARAAQEWAGQRQPGGGGRGDFYWNKISYLGRDYIALALSQYYQNRINDAQLAEYLDTKPRNVGVLEEYFSRGSQ
jgi:Zn-dependent peptidase ImmA (M78 family)